MGVYPPLARVQRGTYSRSAFLCLVGAALFAAWAWHASTLGQTTTALLSLPYTWLRGDRSFLLAEQAGDFDVTFANYSRAQGTAGEGRKNVVPAILHHIALGEERRGKWMDARESCVELHPGWEAKLWTDAEAGEFVRERFPDMVKVWEGYQYPIQRIDALRYMVLYEFGGVILDMDLKCKRALGPLRRFEFVAPAAFPQGFSVGFMMASKGNAFVGELVRSLQVYNRRWFGMPYPTVMFSTGCHFASTIHALQPNRTELKILSGPPDNFSLHSLNGHVSTPLFDHLGSSSWHAYDAAVIVSLGRAAKWWKIHLMAVVATLCFVAWRVVGRRGRRGWCVV